MGRKPKPPAVKRATGNPGRRPIAEYRVPETGPARMPEYLEKHPGAMRLWHEYAPALTVLGTLKKESERLFAQWCVLEDLFERKPVAMNAAKITQIRTLASMLGMDPSSQGKFVTPQNDDNQDPAEEFFRPRLAG